MEPKKVWTKEDIKNLLNTNDKAVARGVLAIYNRQTDNEQFGYCTTESNGVGFNKFDAELMSNLAEWFKSRGYFSENQLKVARKKIMKYAGQLADIANAN